ncbi:hypothetical protein BN1110_06295 [bacterium YEK0313]|nr:hypothetical protein BN1110_06295 [bacterium YEK0313]
MTELEELLREVLVHAPNAPEPMVIRYLREAAQELCRRTLVWRASDVIRVVSPECEGILSIQDAQIHKVETAILNGRPLEAVTVAKMDELEPGWGRRYGNDQAQARWAVQTMPNTITVVPRETGDLDVRMVLLPSRDALTVPDFLADQYGTAIGKGAAARILTINDDEFANPPLGAALAQEWRMLLDELSFQAQRTQLRTKPRTRPNFF